MIEIIELSFGLIGVLIGGLITWIINNKQLQKSMKLEIQLKVADKICEDITEILNLVNDTYRDYKGLDINMSCYFSNNDILMSKKNRYKNIEKSRGRLKDSMDKLEIKFERYTIFLDTNEIVIKQFYNYYKDVYDKFWSFICVVDDFRVLHIGSKYDPESIHYLNEEERNNKELINELEAGKNRVSVSIDEFLQSLMSFNDVILNSFYGNIFKTKANSKIYEVHDGEIDPIERIYRPEKYQEIYKNNKIKRKF